MLSLQPSVIEPIWQAINGLLPERVDTHPFGPAGHRQRTPNRQCFQGILLKLVSGMPWSAVAFFSGVSSATLKRRNKEWVTLGIFNEVFKEALLGYDKLFQLDTSSILLDASHQKAPRGGEECGKSPVDRGKRGYKWSLATDAKGLPLGLVTGPGNVPDYQLMGDTLAKVDQLFLLEDSALLRGDKGYDYPLVYFLISKYNLRDGVTKRRRRGSPKVPREGLGARFVVERANAWLCSFGQLRRNTDRTVKGREAWFGLALALILTVKIVNQTQWRKAY